MMCQECGLDDEFNGRGDGIGSCDCPRCQCCGAGPLECECSYEGFDFEEDDPYDGLCADPACPYLRARADNGYSVKLESDSE